MRFSRIVLVLGAAASAMGCATMPKVTANYYFPRAGTKLVVTQTLGCNTGNTLIVAATDVAPATAYSADPGQPPATIAYSKFGGLLEDSDVTLNFTTDGRLSGINSTFTGEGTTIIKDTVTLAATAAAVGALFAKHQPPVPGAPTKEDIKSACDSIAKFAGAKAGGDPKATTTVTLTYTINLLYSGDGKSVFADPNNNPPGYPVIPVPAINLVADPDSGAIYSALPLLHDKVSVHVEGVRQPKDAANLDSMGDWDPNGKAPSGYELLKLNRVAMVDLVVYGPDANLSNSVPVWRGEVSVPLQQYYPLPIPTGVVFGKEQFTLALSDSGAVTKLEYATNTGAPGVLEAGGAIAGALPTNATLASERAAQSDLIYQEQRLVICKTTPANCPSK